MFRSLLVPLDGSDLSEWSLPLAAKVARATGAELHLARVHERYEPEHLIGNSSFQWEGLDLAEYDGHHRDDESEYLASVTERLDGDGIAVDARLLDGDTAERLTGYADEVHSDLIVITSHGRSGLRRAWLGSVADAMVRRSHRPLLILHPGEKRALYSEDRDIRHIVVPLDGSSASETVLGPARDLALASEARITLVHVMSDPTVFGSRTVTFRPDRVRPELDRTLSYLEALADELREAGVETMVHTNRGNRPAAAIAQVARELDADVIALATHGLGGVKRTVLGSVTDKLLTSTHVPLLVVRPPVAA